MNSTWSWGSPPYFALIRGPFGRAGYQVATLMREDRPGEKIVLLFSCAEKAEAYRQLHPQGHEDWKVGPLPSWHRLHFFLDSMRSTARQVCLDFEESAGSANLALTLEEVVPDLALHAEAERASPDDDAEGEG